MAIDKSKWNTSVKVSQKTIDEIKKMGMAKALKTVAGASAASKQDASAKAWVEGVKRLYGANRVADAVKSTPATPKKTGPMSANTPAKYSSSGPKSMGAKAPAKKAASSSVPQRTLTGTKVSTSVRVAPKAKTTSTKKAAPKYKAPVQKDMYGNKIK